MEAEQGKVGVRAKLAGQTPNPTALSLAAGTHNETIWTPASVGHSTPPALSPEHTWPLSGADRIPCLKLPSADI